MSLQRSSSLTELRRGALSSKKLSSILSPPKLPTITRIILSLISICGVTLLTSFLSGGLTIAVPTIAKQINLSQDSLSWPLSMFSLVSGAMLLTAGAMADAFGRRTVFLVGIAVFAAVSIAASFMKTGEGLIGCCAGLGLAAAMLIPSGVGILGSSIPEGPIKNRIFAAQGASQPVGFILGLVMGGLLANKWRIIFWIQGAAAICFGICAFVSLPHEGEEFIPTPTHSRAAYSVNSTTEVASLSVQGRDSTTVHPQDTGKAVSSDRNNLPPVYLDSAESSSANLMASTPAYGNMSRSVRLRTFDWFGVLMSTSGLVMLTFALADAETAPHGWTTSYVLALLPTSIALLGAFFYWELFLERKQRTFDIGATIGATPHQRRNATFFKAPPTTPLLPPAVWRTPRFGAVLLVIFLAWLSFNVMSYLSTLIFQEVQQISATKTSLYFLPMVVTGIALNMFAGYVVGRIAAVWLIVGGASAGAAACVIMSLGVDVNTPYYKAMLWVLIGQVGVDAFFPAGSLFASKSVGRQYQALAGSLFNTTIRLATSLGLAVSSSISTSVTKSAVAKSAGSSARLVTRDVQIHPSMLFAGSYLVPRAAVGSSEGHTTDSTPVEALLQGYKAAAWFCFACSFLSIVIALAKLKSIGIVGGMEGKVEDPIAPIRTNSHGATPQQGEHELETIVAAHDRKTNPSTSAHSRR
ncbi:related to Cephamycin export protein cmcT [Melanopsichium pennsylvanicum]|uniref:Related to Cephamycin export protein cmcT n=2 Tax=Melanopsichium pennsylvanicum TaxID=63383 RepID=A0AAJ4XQ69_9BASI|nr:related to Cephamycin export protein cmcT [Melanopsichium pennsylvanicum 4]SNX86392.1 related to Cephamycin export protein cmcT [Melanopsichium pennsylvanicum]